MDKEIWGLIWKFVNFTILAVLLYKLLASHIKTFFKNRGVAVKKEIEEADMARKEVEGRYEELKKKLDTIDEEIEDLKEMFRKEGLAEKERIIESANKEAEKIREQAIRSIEQEVLKAKSMIRKESAERIVKMAEELIKKGLTNKDQERIVTEYIEKVVQFN